MANTRERLRLAVIPGSRTEGFSRHSDPSRIAESARALLHVGCGLRYEENTGMLYNLVRRFPLEIAEFRDADIPRLVAEGYANLGIVGSDKVQNLPDALLDNIKIVRDFPFGDCGFSLGVPARRSYPRDFQLEDAGGLTIATALPILLGRICAERGVNIRIFPMSGRVENAIRWGMADIIADITETGGTMKGQGIIPIEPPLASFHAVLIGNNYPLDIVRQRTMERLLGKIDKALQNPERWLNAVSHVQDSDHSSLLTMIYSAVQAAVNTPLSMSRVPTAT